MYIITIIKRKKIFFNSPEENYAIMFCWMQPVVELGLGLEKLGKGRQEELFRTIH